MAGNDRNEVPMLPDTHPTSVDESLDSQSQADMSRTGSMSISIPMESYETGNNLVGSTGPSRSARRAPLVQMNRHGKVVKNWDKFFFIYCLGATFIDSMFLLLFSAQKDNNCVGAFSLKILVVFVVLRSLIDFVYLLNIILKLWRALRALRAYGVYLLNKLLKFRRAPESRVDHPTRIAQNYLKEGCSFFFVDLFLVLPLPQILLGLVLAGLGESAQVPTQMAFVCQYIFRLFTFLPLLGGLIFETAWANFLINLFTFVLFGHVIGSWWYYFGLQRVGDCLFHACVHTGFGGDTCNEFINCGDENPGNEFGSDPNWISWTKNENATACLSSDSFPYGIYKPAVNLTYKNFITRYLFSLFWGFQQMSTLAGNQQPSDNVGEVLFTMLIIVLGLLLFAFLIGNMQNFLKGLGRRKQEFLLRQRDVKQWMSHRGLPKELKKRVRAVEKYKWEVTRGVNEGMLIENLPEDIQKDIRRHMFEFVTTVPSFASMDPPMLDAICGRLKQTIYIKGSKILYPGVVIDKMVFIVRGKLESIGDDGTVTCLYEGSVCGEELLPWFLEHASVSKDGKKIKVTGQGLLSNRTVRCLSNVEAFSVSLGAVADLEEVIHYFASLKKDREAHHKAQNKSIQLGGPDNREDI